MSRAQKSIWITTTMVLVYVISATLSLPFPLVFLFFITCISLLIWMVIQILKDPYTVNKTFDEAFYEDVDLPR